MAPPVGRWVTWPSVLAALLMAVANSGTGVEASDRWQPAAGWRSAGGADHPLVGAILDTRTGNLVGVADLQRRLASAPVVLLGEVHDNGDHHALRAKLFGGRRALVFEHLRPEHAAVLDAVAAERAAGRPSASADELLARLGWETSGWPPASLFRPLFERALADGLAIRPGDAERSRMRDIARGGAAAVPADDAARLALDRPLGDALMQSLLDELEASHCGLMPRTAFTGMAVAQRYRDAVLADAVLAAYDRYGPILLQNCLRGSANGDSVGLGQPSTERFDDGAARVRPGPAVLCVRSRCCSS